MVYIEKIENFSASSSNEKKMVDLREKKNQFFNGAKKEELKEKNKIEKAPFFSWFKKKQADKKGELEKTIKVEKEKKSEEKKIIPLKKQKRRWIWLFLIPQDEKEYFIENLAMLFSSGINILLALDSIKKEVRSSQMKAVIDRMKEDIESGTPIWQVLKETNFFPSFVISLIKIGENSGNLGKNLKVISAQQKKDRVFTSKIRSAMMYPGFVLGLTLVVGIGITWFILPRLTLVFDQLKIKLPLITRALISFGKFIAEYGSIAIPSFIFGLAVIFFFFFMFSRTKFIGQFLLFYFPGIKKLIQETELARMGYIMGTLLKAGLPIRSAMESLVEASTFYRYKKFYTHLKISIEEGNTFGQGFGSFKKSRRLMPSTVQQMIMIGERSGQLPETFFSVGENFEGKIDNTTKNLSVILEPVLLVIVWLGVVAVALAVILPIYSLIGGLNNSGNNQAPIVNAVDPVEIIQETIKLEEKLPEKKLEIKETGLGYLNVRDGGTAKGKIIAKVKPGEQYIYQQESGGWYNIVLNDGTLGWVKGEYVRILDDIENKVE